MEEFLQKLFHVPVKEQIFDNEDKLPLILTGLYEIRTFIIGQKLVHLIHPKEHVALPNLKKHFSKLTMLLEGDCILYDDGYTRYGISKLTELGIPFIFGDNNIYLPNLGIQIHEKTKTKLPDVERFSHFTQKMILMALYQGWTDISGKDIAEALGVSRMTVNRTLLELEALALPLTSMVGKTKYFKNDFSREELYSMCEKFFVNPVKKTIRMKQIPNGLKIKSGISALAKYTLLGEDAYPTFAVVHNQFHELDLDQDDFLSREEIPACVIQIHRYLIPRDGVIDPISAMLSIPKDELDDARVEQAIAEIKEGVFNGLWT